MIVYDAIAINYTTAFVGVFTNKLSYKIKQSHNVLS